MILTESQSLQLATILIEATDEKGPGFVAKVKDVIKRAAKWIKEKAIFLATKIKEGFTKVAKLVLKPVTKLLSNSKFVQDYTHSFNEKHLEYDHVPDLKKYYDTFKLSHKTMSEISSDMFEVWSKPGDIPEEKLTPYKDLLERAMDSYDKVMEMYEERSSKMEVLFRQDMQLRANDAAKVMRSLFHIIESSYDESTRLHKDMDKLATRLEQTASKVSETNSRLQYQYRSKAAYFLGKFSAGWVGFYVKFFASVVSLARRIASPFLNFYKNRSNKED